MTGSKIAIASDHAGVALKATLKSDLEAMGYDVVDLGTDSPDSVDYPDFAEAMTETIESEHAEQGVLICGTGIGMSIAVNRSRAVRAALCHDETAARLAREHNDANIIVLGARTIDNDRARRCLKIFLETPFEGGRHARRVAKLS